MGIENSNKSTNIEDFYRGDKIEQNGKQYKVVNYKKAVSLFESLDYLYGKKVAPTNMRLATEGEEITTYTETGDVEGTTIAKEGDIILQNLNNPKDIYVQGSEILEEYSSGEEGKNIKDLITKDFKPFIRKSSPSKILVGIVEEPIVLLIEEWGNENGPYKQFLDEGATLKLDDGYITGINKGGFEAWDIVSKPAEEVTNSIREKLSNSFQCLNGHKFYFDKGNTRRICQKCGYTQIGTYDFLNPQWSKK